MSDQLVYPDREPPADADDDARERFVLTRLYGAALLDSGIVDDLKPPQVRQLIEHAVDWWLEVFDREADLRAANNSGDGR